MRESGSRQARIVLGVTADQSLALMRGFPEALAGDGWEVHVVCGGGPNLSELEGIDGVATHTLPMQRQPAPLKDLASLIDWVRLLRSIRPDVISTGTPKAGLLGMIAARITRVPRRVYLLRGLRLEGAKGPQRHVLRTLERIASACSTDVLAVSQSLKDVAVDLDIVNESKITVLGRGSSNGVDVERFRPDAMTHAEMDSFRRSLGLGLDLPVVGFVGRLTTDKGVADLVAASRALSLKGIVHQLVVVGEIEEASMSEVAVVGDGTEAEIIVTGRVTDTAAYYQVMDALALPTLREGMPNVALEAQASGIPVVTTDVTGARNSVIDGETGFLTPFGDVEALAGALAKIITDPVRKHAMGLAGRQFVVDHFAQEGVWRRLKSYYKDHDSGRMVVRRSVPAYGSSPESSHLCVNRKL